MKPELIFTRSSFFIAVAGAKNFVWRW